jgi:tetratricopeptide (TPR) repeat protein
VAAGSVPVAGAGAVAAGGAPSGAGDPVAGSPGNDDVALRIERCERWLGSYPNDAMLLLSLGRLCIRAGQLTRAQGYLEGSLSIEPTHSAHLALARLHQALNHQEAAASHRDQALSLALRALDTATGGRRRVSL